MLTPEEQVKSVLKQGKMSGSWMIVGPYGVGKRTFVRRLNSFLMTGDWNKVLDFHPDIKWIERGLTEEEKKETVKAILAGKTVETDDKNRARKKEITVDDIREGLKFLSLKSSGTGRRILVVSLADEMNENAANALLKMLEEPFFNTIIILVCQNTGKLLPTIRSRCRKIIMPALTNEKMKAELPQILPHCKDIDLLIDLSEGSVGLAKDIWENKGIELYQKMLSFCVPTAQIDVEKLTSFTDMFIKDDGAFLLLKTFLLGWIGRQIKALAEQGDMRGEEWLDFYSQTERLFYDIDALYLDRKQSLFNLFLKLSERAEV